VFYSLFIAILVAAGCILYPPASQAQTTRPLQVTVDSVRLNVCGEKTFTVDVDVSSILRSDSVFAIQTIIHWDFSKFDFDTRLLRNGTLSSQTGEPVVYKEGGVMVIQIGNTNPDGMIVGSGPLFSLIGTIKAPDTVAPPDGWIEVREIELTGTTSFQVTKSPGLVQVVRESTPAYTGRIAVSEAGFDTLRLDTVSISLSNVRARRVREVGFRLEGDTSAYEFVGIVEEGTLAGADLWSSRQINVGRDSVDVRLIARSDLGQDGILLKIVLRRTTDSAFSRPLGITEFSVGQRTCLGRLIQEGTEVAASSIIRDSTPVAVRDDRQRRGDRIGVRVDQAGERIMVSTEDFVVRHADVFDLMGRPVANTSIEPDGTAGFFVRLERPLANGRYVIVLHGIDQIVSKQFIVIK
jgi:hypothetical protein